MGNSKNDSDNDWSPELEELHLRESLASNMGGPEKRHQHPLDKE